MQNKETSIKAIIKKTGKAQVLMKNCNGMEIGFMVTAIIAAAGKAAGEVIPESFAKRFLLASVIEGLKQADLPVLPEDLQELADTLETNTEGTA